MAEEIKIGDKVRVNDAGLMMLQRFAPPNAKPNNEGIVSEIWDKDYLIYFPIGDDDPEKHSQAAPYPKFKCTKIK